MVKNTAYQTEKFISKNDNIVVAEESKTYLVIVKKNYLNTS
jgi:hypothetical protein